MFQILEKLSFHPPSLTSNIQLELSEDLTIAPLWHYQEKDKLVPENWKDREKRIIPKPYAYVHSMQKTSAKFQNN